MVIIHYSAASCCCVPSLHRSSPSRSILAPAIFFFRDAAPNLRLVSVWSQPPGSEGFGEPNKHSSRDASVGFSASSSSVIDFLTLCHRLKTTKRKGWVNHGIKGAESIADHMYRMALMALVSGDVPGLDRERKLLIGDAQGAFISKIPESLKQDMIERLRSFSQEKNTIFRTLIRE